MSKVDSSIVLGVEEPEEVSAHSEALAAREVRRGRETLIGAAAEVEGVVESREERGRFLKESGTEVVFALMQVYCSFWDRRQHISVPS